MKPLFFIALGAFICAMLVQSYELGYVAALKSERDLLHQSDMKFKSMQNIVLHGDSIGDLLEKTNVSTGQNYILY